MVMHVAPSVETVSSYSDANGILISVMDEKTLPVLSN
jgi:hypothetical protein